MMDISGVSMTNGLAQVASSMKNQDVQMQLAAAMMKQVLDQQEMMGKLLAELIQSVPSPDPQVGTNVDISV